MNPTLQPKLHRAGVSPDSRGCWSRGRSRLGKRRRIPALLRTNFLRNSFLLLNGRLSSTPPEPGVIAGATHSAARAPRNLDEGPESLRTDRTRGAAAGSPGGLGLGPSARRPRLLRDPAEPTAATGGLPHGRRVHEAAPATVLQRPGMAVRLPEVNARPDDETPAHLEDEDRPCCRPGSIRSCWTGSSS